MSSDQTAGATGGSDTSCFEDVAQVSQKEWRVFADHRFNIRGSDTSLQVSKEFLDQEEYSARLAIVHLRRQYNRLLPISQLPQELLCRIFLQIQQEELATWYHKHCPGWNILTHVCHTWRSIALDYAELWAAIPSSLVEECAAEFLRRSKRAKLFVLLSDELFAASWQHNLICREMSRIGIFELRNMPYPAIRLLFSLINTNTPNQLANFTLHSNMPYALEDAYTTIFSHSHMPNLRGLALTNVYLPWEVIPWASLRFVHMNLPPAHIFKPELAPLITALASAHNLHCLSLDMRRCIFAPGKAPDGIVQLPNLQSLAFAGDTDDFSRLFDAIHIPSSPTIKIKLFSDEHGTAKPAAVSALLRAHDFRGCAQAMRISVDSTEYAIRAEAWRSRQNFFAAETDTPFIDVSLQPQRLDNTSLLTLQALCEDIDLSSLCQLELSVSWGTFNYAGGESNWHDMFSAAHNVDTVSITQSCIMSLLEAIAAPVDNSASKLKRAGIDLVQGPHLSLFPLLKHVYLTDCAGSPSEWRGLPAVMGARAQHAPIETLYVMHCSIRRDTFDELTSVKGLGVVRDGLLLSSASKIKKIPITE